MSWEERCGLLLTVIVMVAAGLIMWAADQDEAKVLSDCAILERPPDTNFSVETKILDGVSQDLVSEAEHFVCHEIRHPAEVQGWRLKGMDAFRMNFRGQYSWRANLRYTLGVYGAPSARYLVLEVRDARTANPSVIDVGSDDPDVAVEKIALRSRRAELVRGGPDSNGIVVRWHESGLSFVADLLPATGGQDVSTRQLLGFLGSLH